ncbi:helix-turn-helix domain-containing protein [Halocatena salina]|uniref:Helix-turn-helix domain-containing protein n=1 Tax=Halocatena salina TaxID=2934340 RepID=A0A8U0A0U8_9EURY|nr:helix-turn-helix domain-containing protein [Halocatena salina]UPM42740.1 helix-turn-helix domain-containing protein [Halocatena salina]
MGIRTERNATRVAGIGHRDESTLVCGRLPTEAFALHETFSTIPDLTVECAPLAAAGETANMSMLWANTDEADLIDVLENDPTVFAAKELCRTEDRHLYRVEWTPDVHRCIEILLQSQGILLSNRGVRSGWSVEILYPTREDVRTAMECCERYELSVTIDSIRSLDSDRAVECGLTPAQHTVLTQACRDGYFDVPREIGLEELADKMNVSHQALSERLRRGHDTLIRSTLIETSSVSPTAPSSTLSL